ncbi:MAG TPA: TRAP transporter large permease subunit, partial [Spirochaetota bacterium]|nr:TRAP transporter large permease subunit [Spirochaetota bacterium]
MMTPTTVGLVGLFALVALLFTRMPVGFIMAVVGFVGFAAIVSFDAALKLAANDVYSVFSSYNLTVIPLFVFMGQ